MSKESTPVLFVDAPTRTNEAKQTFTEIVECSYLNRHLGDSGQKETMTCDCVEDWHEVDGNMACGEDLSCINRLTSVECNNRSCTCGRDCQNQRFQKRQYASVRVIQTEKKGYGLVAASDILENLFVYEYVGEVIDEKTFRARMVDYDRRNLRHFYFMMLAKDAFIDATEKGSLARFCNHLCLPNAYVDKWVVGDKLRMGIFAKRRILCGEEITFDYNVDRYGAQSQQCHCGESNCMGWIGGKTQTDAALLLPDGISEALGATRQQERSWMKQYRAKNQARKGKRESSHDLESEADSEDSTATAFVKSLHVTALSDGDVARAMSALMKVDDRVVVSKLIERLYLTEDPKIHAQVVKLHGYKTLSKVLKQHREDDTLTFRVLLVLQRWPSMTRNKIELSQIEDEVRAIAETLPHERTTALAAQLIAEWGQLEMAYRIPKTRDGKLMSPLLGRSGRSELPEDTGINIDDGDSLPEGWQKALDTSTNTVYYYHTGLGISKWEKPTAEIPRGPKETKAQKPAKSTKAPKAAKNAAKPKQAKRRDDLALLEEQRLQQAKEEQFREVQDKQKLLQELIVESQRAEEEKRRAAEQAKAERMEKHRERRRKKEAAFEARARARSSEVSPEVLWTKVLARHVPNMIKKHEAEIGHANVKGCARDAVKAVAAKEARHGMPPTELDSAKIAKLRVFCDGFMEKFLEKFRAKRARHHGANGANGTSEATGTNGASNRAEGDVES